MANIDIANIDRGGPVFEADADDYSDELLTLAGAATVKAGTILARDSVSLKLVPYVKGGSTHENGIPKAVLTYQVVATGAGDVPVRALVKGDLITERLVIHADGDGDNVDAAVTDGLRAYGLGAVSCHELGITDNPQDS